MFGGVFAGSPSVREASAIVVADEGVFIALLGVPSAAPRSAVREMPCEKERVIGVRSRREGSTKRQRAHWPRVLRLRPEFAIGRKIVPVKHGRVPPAAALPSS